MTKTKQSLLEEWQITEEELDEVLREHKSMQGYVIGYMAEYKLRKLLATDGRIKYIGKSDDHDRKDKSDLIIEYKEQRFTIEVKSLQAAKTRDLGDGKWKGRFQCDASDNRVVTFEDGSTLKTTCLLTGQFDILAACIFQFRKKWEFGFAKNVDLRRSPHKKYTDYQRKFLLVTEMAITLPLTPPYREDLVSLCDEIIAARASSHLP